MYVLRWMVRIVLGFLVGYLSLSLVAALFYALPRAVSNAARGFVGWGVSRFYLLGALAYAAVLLVVVLIAYCFVGLEHLLVGALLPIVPMVMTVKKLQADVDERLGKALIVGPSCKEPPSWAGRTKS